MKRFFQNGTISMDMMPRDMPNSQENLLRLPQYTGIVYNATSIPTTPTTPQPTSPMPTPALPMSKSHQYFDMQSTRTSSPAPSTTTIPLGSNPYGQVQNFSLPHMDPTRGSNAALPSSHMIDRNDLHKGLKNLENLLIIFDEYKDLKMRLAKCEKKLAKSMSDLSKSKMLEDVPVQTLQSSAVLFDSITETTSKHAKLIQKEYEAMNEHCGKYFKRIGKEEKLHDELMDTLDTKVKKAHATHEKNSKRSGRIVVESHDRYIQTVQALTQEISRAKASHGSLIGTKTYITSLVVASTLGGIADSEFKATCEMVRKAGPHVGKLNEWLNFASSEGMTSIQPADLSEEGTGWAQIITQRESEIVKETKKIEEARLAQMEHAQTVWKAQQMGWLPPPSIKESRPRILPTPPTSMSNQEGPVDNLPRLNSEGQEVQPKQAAEVDILRSVSKADSATSRRSADSKRITSTEVKPMDVKQETAVKLQEVNVLEGDYKDSTSMEGTFIDKGIESSQKHQIADQEASMSTYGSSPAKSSNSSLNQNHSSTMTSFSMSQNHSRQSEDAMILEMLGDNSRGPSTPVDETPSTEVAIAKSSPENVETILKRSETMEEDKIIAPEKEVYQYVDVKMPEDNSAIYKGPQRVDSIADRAHRLTSREHEREVERKMEREMELQRRLRQAEDRLTYMDQGAQRISPSNQSSSYRPRYSEPTQSYRARHAEQEILADRYDPNRYTPAIGHGKVSTPGINRTLSTDSERSFVARMKARYQAEKEEKYKVAPLRSANVYIDSQKPNPIYSYQSSARRPQKPPRPEEYKDMHRADCRCPDCSPRDHPLGSRPSVQRESKFMPSTMAPSAPPPNYRRQSMPPVREDYNLLKAPPAPAGELQPRRSFEEERGDKDRKVMFASRMYS